MSESKALTSYRSRLCGGLKGKVSSAVRDVDRGFTPGPESEVQIRIEKYCRRRGYPCFQDASRPDLLIIALSEGRTLWVRVQTIRSRQLLAEEVEILNLVGLGHQVLILKDFAGFLQVVNGNASGANAAGKVIIKRTRSTAVDVRKC